MIRNMFMLLENRVKKRPTRNNFIDELEARLKQTSKTETLFDIAWKVV